MRTARKPLLLCSVLGLIASVEPLLAQTPGAGVPGSTAPQPRNAPSMQQRNWGEGSYDTQPGYGSDPAYTQRRSGQDPYAQQHAAPDNAPAMPRWRGGSTWRDDYDPRHADRRYRDRWSAYDGTRGNFYSVPIPRYPGPRNAWGDSTGMGRGFDWRQ